MTSRSAGGDIHREPVGVKQFDIQSAGQMIYTFGEGWHEAEYEITGRRWRWTSERSGLRVKGGVWRRLHHDARGIIPFAIIQAPPTVRITAAGREIARFRPDTDFKWTVPSASGAIVIETDPVCLPGHEEGTADERRLGLLV